MLILFLSTQKKTENMLSLTQKNNTVIEHGLGMLYAFFHRVLFFEVCTDLLAKTLSLGSGNRD